VAESPRVPVAVLDRTSVPGSTSALTWTDKLRLPTGTMPGPIFGESSTPALGSTFAFTWTDKLRLSTGTMSEPMFAASSTPARER
jgi:hypothetical protein